MGYEVVLFSRMSPSSSYPSSTQAFHNPPLAMASLFRRALTELPEFTNVFEEVVFSILERSGSDNMRPWSETWRGLIADESQAAAKPSKVENKEEVIVLDD